MNEEWRITVWSRNTTYVQYHDARCGDTKYTPRMHEADGFCARNKNTISNYITTDGIFCYEVMC